MSATIGSDGSRDFKVRQIFWVQMKPLGRRNQILIFSRMFIRIIYLHVKFPYLFSVRMIQDGYEVMFKLFNFNLTTLMSLHAAEHQNLISEA